MEINKNHEKILEVIKERGPSLPVQIARVLGMSSLFISAFLSELASEKRIKISHLKVGGSPLYYLEGQEEQLEPFYKYLHPREAETFLILKKHNILKDSEQDPAIRVALRSIRDFSIGFRHNHEIYWRYVLIPEQEAIQLLKPKKEKQTIKKKELIKEKKSKISETTPTKIPSPLITITKESARGGGRAFARDSSKSVTSGSASRDNLREGGRDKVSELQNQFQNPLIIKQKLKKQKPKSEFIQKTINFLNQNNIKILEEKNYKAKEYNCIIQINSQLGPVNFLTQAKDKKTITETDFKKLLSNAQSIPLPAFMLYTGEVSKKAKGYLKNYSSILKAKRVG